MLVGLHMYRLFSPKDYTFLGLIFGLPTALYASYRNGGVLKDTHPEVLAQVKKFVGIFVGLLVLMVIVDTAHTYYTVGLVREFIRLQASTPYFLIRDAGGNGMAGLVNAFELRVSIISWIFIAVQLVVLALFVKKAKQVELPVYESLKQSQQMTARSNVELLAVGIGVWILFWLYGQLVAKIMVTLIQRG